jgi:hypothetical protein
MQSIKKHPVTITFYLLYLAVCFCDIQGAHAQSQNGHAMCGIPLPLFIGPLFGSVVAVNAIARSSDQTMFYLCMLALIIISPIILNRC